MARIFISHSSADKTYLVEPLYHELTSKGHEVWYDRVSPGGSIPLEISSGLASADTFLLVISQSYNTSSWCRMELGAIIANCIGTGKRMLVIRLDEAPVEPLIAHLRSLAVSSRALTNEAERTRFLREIANRLAGLEYEPVRPRPRASASAAVSIVEQLLDADRNERFGVNLLETAHEPGADVPKLIGRAEGLILIKPGGTFYEPCLEELIRRIQARCEVCQVRLFNGHMIRSRNLFERQYVSNTKLAAGDIGLKEDDYESIRSIYDQPEFKAHFGVSYSDELVVPALQLERPPYGIDPTIISERWEAGRAEELFWNREWNGLNKIGYQKTVFPIVFDELPEEPKVRIVLNGFIPGYKALFEDSVARTVAIHVKTSFPWREIREELVGGQSDPGSCLEGSIRRDAYDGGIPLDPRGGRVNGQRNVCHASATLLDGMRELVVWFEYPDKNTILGSVLGLMGCTEEEIAQIPNKHLEDISWTTRNDSFAEILYEVRQGQVFDNLKGAENRRRKAGARFSKDAGVDPGLVQRSERHKSFIENGVRWRVGGPEYYLFTIAKTLFQSANQRAAFYDVAEEIARLQASRWQGRYPEIIAEAIRIAASDLRFLGSPIYEQRIDRHQLFSAQVLAELPEQALGCAERTHKNLIKDLAALVPRRPRTTKAVSIHETVDWREFVDSLENGQMSNTQPAVGDSPIGLVLAGGRSTRMNSTIPKPVLPFERGLLLDAVGANLRQAVGDPLSLYAAVGFRSRLIQRALGDRLTDGQEVRYLENPKVLGLAFRVATALEILARTGGDDRLVVLTYTDMPTLSPNTIRSLIEKVRARDSFGLLTCLGAELSGHVEEEDGRIKRVIQRRLDPDLCAEGMRRDVGLYVFRNTAEIRNAILSIRNDNLRGEFIFADVVERLVAQGVAISHEDEDPVRARSVNTIQDLLRLVSARFIRAGNKAGLDRYFKETFDLELSSQLYPELFQPTVQSHAGPLYFFSWWERTWVSKE